MRILVACDGSVESRNALTIAAELPVSEKEIDLISVGQNFDTIGYAGEPDQNLVLKYNTQTRENCEQVLSEAVHMLEKQGLQKKVHTHITDGYPSEEIRKFAMIKNTDLIIMGHRGLNPVKRFFMGSVSDGVVKHSNCPVLLATSAKSEKEQLVFTRPLRLLLGYDGSHSSEKALGFLKSFEPGGIAKTDLLSAVEINYYFGMSAHMAGQDIYPFRQVSLRRQHKRIIQDLKLWNPDMDVESHIVSDCQDVAQQLDRYGNEYGSDLIVVGNKGLNPIDKLLLGSVSSRLAHQTKTSLLIVK